MMVLELRMICLITKALLIHLSGLKTDSFLHSMLEEGVAGANFSRERDSDAADLLGSSHGHLALLFKDVSKQLKSQQPSHQHWTLGIISLVSSVKFIVVFQFKRT